MLMSDLLTILRDFGFPIALVLFFVWHSQKREERLASRIQDLENYQRTELSTLVSENTKCMLNNTNVMMRLESWLERHDTKTN